MAQAENPLSSFAEEIIQFQKQNNLTDTDMALASHVSVEHIHNIKSMRELPDAETLKSLKEFMER